MKRKLNPILSILDLIPNEILYEIFLFCSLRSILKFYQCCKRLKEIIDTEYFKKIICLRSNFIYYETCLPRIIELNCQYSMMNSDYIKSCYKKDIDCVENLLSTHLFEPYYIVKEFTNRNRNENIIFLYEKEEKCVIEIYDKEIQLYQILNSEIPIYLFYGIIDNFKVTIIGISTITKKAQLYYSFIFDSYQKQDNINYDYLFSNFISSCNISMKRNEFFVRIESECYSSYYDFNFKEFSYDINELMKPRLHIPIGCKDYKPIFTVGSYILFKTGHIKSYHNVKTGQNNDMKPLKCTNVPLLIIDNNNNDWLIYDDNFGRLKDENCFSYDFGIINDGLFYQDKLLLWCGNDKQKRCGIVFYELFPKAKSLWVWTCKDKLFNIYQHNNNLFIYDTIKECFIYLEIQKLSPKYLNDKIQEIKEMNGDLSDYLFDDQYMSCHNYLSSVLLGGFFLEYFKLDLKKCNLLDIIL